MNAIHPISETTDTVTLARADFEALREAWEDSEDLARSRQVVARIEGGEEEALPIEMVERLIAGESPIRVWRDYRGMTGTALAAAAGIPQGYLSEIERGKKPGTVETLVKIARVLSVTIDDLVTDAGE